MTEARHGPGPARLLLFSAILFVMVAGTILVLGEIILRLFFAQPYMMPRYEYSYLYGHRLPASTTMVAARPGHWSFDYTINEYGYRGDPVPISERYERTNVVVLGDSYSMGAGVSDEDVYSVILDEALGECFDVVNLGVGGYGLTQQIRRFYEFGVLYQPEVVVLQFFSNDPADNFHDRVTVIEDGRFRFVPTVHETGWLKSALADSVVQYSQVYNLLRNSIYRAVRRWRIDADDAVEPHEHGAATAPPDRVQAFYNELLTHFAHDLHARGIELVFIAVNRSMKRFPYIRQQVEALDGEGVLRYVDVEPWFDGVEDYGSPEGHGWGELGHRIVGKGLARAIRGTRGAEEGAGGGCSGPSRS